MGRKKERLDVTIRGTGAGLVIDLGEAQFEGAMKRLEELLTSRASFFLGGRAALHTGDRRLSIEQMTSIGQMVERFGMTLWAVHGDHPETHVAARELGLETKLRRPRTSATDEVAASLEMAGIVVKRTLRSGQVLHHAGHITLLGDVNPGAEVVAGGDVIVWGRLRGTVHAGAIGDEGAVVCALQLAPSQIRIASHIARSPERTRPPKVPEVASVQQGNIIVERWTHKQDAEK